MIVTDVLPNNIIMHMSDFSNQIMMSQEYLRD